MPKPSTPAIWASNKAFSFTPNAQQIAQGFDYIATIGRPEGAPITDDHDWPFNQVTSALKWVMDQLPDGGLKYGCPLVGSLIHWPLQQMPQEIWPDCGMIFIPYIAQAFDPVKYPLLKALHPSGVLPADMRGEFPRGWDNGRGVDSGRVLMSAQADAVRRHRHATGLTTSIDDAYYPQGAKTITIPSEQSKASFSAATISTTKYLGTFDGFKEGQTQDETRSRNIAWNVIVRAA
ncbi:MAG: hypothetical protein ACRC4K_14710 [Plesiomonas shigelloides]